MRALVAATPTPGSNTVIVTHKPNIMEAFGKDWFDVKEGEASVFKTAPGDKPALVRRVPIDQWKAVD